MSVAALALPRDVDAESGAGLVLRDPERGGDVEHGQVRPPRSRRRRSTRPQPCCGTPGRNVGTPERNVDNGHACARRIRRRRPGRPQRRRCRSRGPSRCRAPSQRRRARRSPRSRRPARCTAPSSSRRPPSGTRPRNGCIRRPAERATEALRHVDELERKLVSCNGRQDGASS